MEKIKVVVVVANCKDCVLIDSIVFADPSGRTRFRYSGGEDFVPDRSVIQWRGCTNDGQLRQLDPQDSMQSTIVVAGADHEQLGSGSHCGEIFRQWLVVA